VTTVWSEGVFQPGDNFLDRLLEAPSEYDFAVMVWAADDTTDTAGVSRASPRDNVVFECGLFMGALGKSRVFVVHDIQGDIKIPSDFAGITLVGFEGQRCKDNPQAGVRSACDQIALAIGKVLIEELNGPWRERYPDGGDINPMTVEADIEIATFADGVSFTRIDDKTKEIAFSANGRFSENQIRGEWKNRASHVLDRGAFLLVLNTPANVLYGYCSARDADGGTIFQPWVLAKKAGQTGDALASLLDWGQKTLTERTLQLHSPNASLLHGS